MSDRITVKCQACGEAENCDIFCELTIDNIVGDIDELLCPLTGDEAQWEIVKGGDSKE